MIKLSPSELGAGARDSWAMLRVHWGISRSVKSRVVFLVAALFISGGLLVTSHLGDLAKMIALTSQGDDSDAISKFSISTLTAINSGQLGDYGVGILAALILSAVITPFSGAVSTSFINPRDALGLTANLWHRFWDSIVSQILSSASILQLLMITGLASLATVGGGRTYGLMFTWTIWLSLSAVSVLLLWAAEFSARRFGSNTKRAILAAIVVAIAAAVALFPEQGRGAFGLGRLYVNLVPNVGGHSPYVILAIFSSTAAIGVAALAAAALFSQAALSLPETGVPNKKASLDLAGLVQGYGTTATLLRTLLRHEEGARTVGMVTVLGAIGVFFNPNSLAISSAFAISIPFSISLLWGANALSHLGGGAAWLASQPNSLKNAPWVIYLIQVTYSLVVFMVVWTPAILAGRVILDTFLINLLATMATTIIVSSSATRKAILRAAPLHFGTRAASTLSATRALNYTIRFALWSGQYGVIILLVAKTPVVALGLALVAGVWQFLRMYLLSQQWSDSRIRHRALSAVASD